MGCFLPGVFWVLPQAAASAQELLHGGSFLEVWGPCYPLSFSVGADTVSLISQLTLITTLFRCLLWHCPHLARGLCVRGASAFGALAFCSWPGPDPFTALLSLSQDSGGGKQFMSKARAWCLREVTLIRGQSKETALASILPVGGSY